MFGKTRDINDTLDSSAIDEFFGDEAAAENTVEIHDLHLPWWWGAQWFEHLLLDYDVSSNGGNWAYIAGVGADPRPVRKFNMAVQAERYDPDGSYRKWGAAQGWSVPDDALPVEFPGVFY